MEARNLDGFLGLEFHYHLLARHNLWLKRGMGILGASILLLLLSPLLAVIALLKQAIIEQVKSASSMGKIPNLKKLQGYETYYRIRMGDYQIGLEVMMEGRLLLCEGSASRSKRSTPLTGT